jgi:hypothetical protein
MLYIVPLAGPDFFTEAYGFKPFVQIDGNTLIERTLGSRLWFQNGEVRPENVVFVVRQVSGVEQVVARLSALFPGSEFVAVSCLTRGALLSAVAALGLAKQGDDPVVVDLVDLIYSSSTSPFERLRNDPSVCGLIPWFRSKDPSYSYLELDKNRVLRTAEKTVISSCASAGTYFFRSISDFLAAVGASLADPERYVVRGNHFVCPSYNGLIARGFRIEGCEVSDVVCYSKRFHS